MASAVSLGRAGAAHNFTRLGALPELALALACGAGHCAGGSGNFQVTVPVGGRPSLSAGLAGAIGGSGGGGLGGAWGGG